MEEKNNKNKKEITLEDVAGLISGLEKSIEGVNKTLTERIESSNKATIKTLVEKIESSKEELAIMTQKQFLEYDEKMEKRFVRAEKKLDHIEA